MLMRRVPEDHIPDIINWLENQPPEKGYSFQNTDGDCLVGRYGRARGKDWHNVHNDLYLRGELFIASNHWLPGGETYGAALERAKRCIKERT